MRRRPLLFCLICTSLVGCNAILGIEGGSFDPPSQEEDASPESGIEASVVDSAIPKDGTAADTSIEDGAADAKADADAAIAPDADAGTEADADADAGGGCGDTLSDPKNCGVCGHDCIGGDCTNGICQPWVVAAEAHSVLGNVSLDANNVFYTDTQNAAILSTPKNAIQGKGTAIYSGIAGEIVENVTWHDGFVYFLDDPAFVAGSNASLVRCPDTGCTTTPQTVLATGSPLTSFGFGSTGVLWIAEVDGTIYRCADVLCASVTTPIEGENNPRGLLVQGDNLAWTASLSPAPGRALRVKVGGLDPATVVSESFLVSIGLSDTEVYWADGSTSDGISANLLSNPTTTRSVALQVTASQMTTDAQFFYFAEASVKQDIERVPLGGNKAVSIATGNSAVGGLAVDDKAVYWSEPVDEIVRAVAK
jgi:hypothetical protein